MIAQIARLREAPRVPMKLKQRLAEAVAAELRERLASGHVAGLLPGVRTLALDLGVSVPTVCKALHLLGGEGLLAGGGKRRRWRTADPSALANERDFPTADVAGANDPGKRSGRLLFLAPQPLSQERHSGVQLFVVLLNLLGTLGWDVMHRVEQVDTAKSPRKSWDELLHLTKPDAIVAVGGTPVLAHWAKTRELRMLFIGGDPGNSGVPILAVKVSKMLQDAIHRLLTLGHRRILLPLCGRSAGFVAKCRESVMSIVTAAKLERKEVIIAETTYAKPEVMVALLRRQWLKHAPDALILLDWREFVAASNYFRDTGIVIPRDLSVVILSQNPNMEWHLPPISHFELPVKPMARLIVKWVTSGATLQSSPPGKELQARWIEGHSIARRDRNPPHEPDFLDRSHEKH